MWCIQSILSSVNIVKIAMFKSVHFKGISVQIPCTVQVLYCGIHVFFYVHNFCFQVVYPKTDDQRKRLNDAVKNILLFKNVALVSFSGFLITN